MKRLLFILTLAAFAGFNASQLYAHNDECIHATPITVGTTVGNCGPNVTSTNSGATNSSGLNGTPTGCPGSFQGGDIWFSSVVPSSGRIGLDLVADVWSTAIVAAYTGSCGSLTQLTCQSINTTNLVLTGLTGGSTILYRAWDWGNNNIGNITVCTFEPPPPPSNDECSGAISVTMYTSVGACANTLVNHAAATGSSESATCASTFNRDDDLWYSFVATSISVRVRGTNVSSMFSFGSAIYDACGGTQLGCDAFSLGSPDLSDIVGGLTVGNTYLLRVWDNTTADARWNMCVFAPPPPPVNDECSGAILITQAATEAACTFTLVNTSSSTKSLPNPSCTSFNNDDDLWYEFVAVSARGRVRFTNVQNMFSMGVAIYDACGGTQLFCDAFTDGSNPDRTTAFSGMTVGNTYLLRTWDNTTNFVRTNMCVYAPAEPPPNDECTGAIPIPFGATGVPSCTLTEVNFKDATRSLPNPSCTSFNNDDDLWYSFVPTGTTARVLMFNIQSAFSIGVAVYTSCGGSQVRCDAFTFGSNPDISDLFTGLIPGNTYYLRVWDNTTLDARVNICIVDGTPPSNDNCSGAITVGVAGALLGGIGFNWTGPANFPTIAGTLGFAIATPSTPDVTSLSFGPTSAYAHSHSSTNLLTVTLDLYDGVNNVWVNIHTEPGVSTGVSFPLTNRTFAFPNIALVDSFRIRGSYFISQSFHGWTNVQMAFNTVSGTGCTPTQVSTFFTTRSSPNPSCTRFANNDDVWFEFTATNPGVQIFVSDLQGGFGIGAAVYTSCGGSQIGCDAFLSGNRSDPFCGLIVGQTYVLRTWFTGSSDQGTFDMCLIGLGTGANNDLCGSVLGGFNIGTPDVTGISVPYDLTCASAEIGERTPGVGSGFPGPGSCNSLDGWCSFDTRVQNSLWWTFTVPPTGNVSIISNGSGDPQIALYRDITGGLVFIDCFGLVPSWGFLFEVAANDDGNGQNVDLTDVCGRIPFIPGELIYMQLDGTFGRQAAGTLTLKEIGILPSPTNDDCSNARPLVDGGTDTGNTTCANLDGVATCGITQSAPGVWFVLNSGTASSIIVSTDNPGTDYDTYLSLYAGVCGSLICVDSDDDGGTGLTSVIQWCTAPNTDYYLLVHGFGAGIGNFEVTATYIPQLIVDAGGCQTRFLGYSPADTIPNFLIADVTGGTPPYTYEWGFPSGEVCFNWTGPANFPTAFGTLGIGMTTPPATNVTSLTIGTTGAFGHRHGGAPIDITVDVFDAINNIWVNVHTETGVTTGYNFGGQVYTFTSIALVTGVRFEGSYFISQTFHSFNAFEMCFNAGNVQTGPFCSPTGAQRVCVLPDTTTTFQVTVTDGAGCSRTDTVVVLVIDVERGVAGQKVQVCHHPPGGTRDTSGNLVQPVQQIIAKAAVPAHIDDYHLPPPQGHGICHLGPCGNECLEVNEGPPPCVDIDDFDPGIDLAMWTSIVGGIANTDCGSASGNALKFNSAGFASERSATTKAVNVQYGGDVTFWLVFGSGSFPCENADPGEDVVLEYSTNGGASFSQIARYDTEDFTTFTYITQGLPIGAHTVATMLRWRQLTHNGTNFDNWAIDEVAFCPEPAPNSRNKYVQSEQPVIESGVAGGIATISAYPNPFSNSTTIAFALVEDGMATLEVYNTAGALVGTLFNGQVKSGVVESVTFDATDLPVGIYMYRLTNGQDSYWGKLSLIK